MLLTVYRDHLDHPNEWRSFFALCLEVLKIQKFYFLQYPEYNAKMLVSNKERALGKWLKRIREEKIKDASL